MVFQRHSRLANAGRLGGKAQEKKLSKKRRVEIARKAVAAREAKRKMKTA
jgi:hypothetical protein